MLRKQYRNPNNNLLKNFNRLLLRYLSPVGDFLGQGAAVAVLDNHNFEPFVLVDIVQLHDMVGVDTHHELRFCLG